MRVQIEKTLTIGKDEMWSIILYGDNWASWTIASFHHRKDAESFKESERMKEIIKDMIVSFPMCFRSMQGLEGQTLI